MLGSVVVSLADHSSSDDDDNIGSNPVSGDILALLSAFFYGCYTTYIKYQFSKIDMEHGIKEADDGGESKRREIEVGEGKRRSNESSKIQEHSNGDEEDDVDDRISFQLLFGYMGAINLILGFDI